MHNFKVGDVVERVRDEDYFYRTQGTGPYVVTSVSVSGRWVQINGWDDSGGDPHPWDVGNFRVFVPAYNTTHADELKYNAYIEQHTPQKLELK